MNTPTESPRWLTFDDMQPEPGQTILLNRVRFDPNKNAPWASWLGYATWDGERLTIPVACRLRVWDVPGELFWRPMPDVEDMEGAFAYRAILDVLDNVYRETRDDLVLETIVRILRLQQAEIEAVDPISADVKALTFD